MNIIDLHCDVLYKLAIAEEPLSFLNSPELDVTLNGLKAMKAKAQVFAIFVDENIPQSLKYLEALRQIEKFQYEVVAPYDELVHITNWQQLAQLKDGQIGAILSMEGLDAIGDDLNKLQSFIDAGILLAGLTWNNENAVAYGAIEDPTKGLKEFGQQALQLLNDHNIIVDVTHLNEQSFWDVLPLAKHVVASHSNVHTLCPCPRNLKDDQMTALVEAGGHIHLVYYPLFVKNGQEKGVHIEELVAHFMYAAKLVGADKLGLGSDFDGMAYKIEELQNCQDAQLLLQHLAPHFTEAEIIGIAATNFERFVTQIECK
ncbi:dipeptidase [Kurthia sibirica]|uniref:Diguanylate cyclase n=1 Tax=Kurthia sibirica TaxID=202750 RepID=A0A2U3AJU4_9BACL|nr:membrane dipeptidase [Kurthia sibirica]PWI24802.1 diguanylate cyclase [Kurthia sibirica]GEK35576.1 dipeptidase [Kurthia sibirica]